MEPLCDLHTHSYYSDGTWSPAALISQAAAQGLSAVALTDHNTLAGLSEFLTAAENTAVEAIPGVEISTEYLGKELHIVGLFLSPSCWQEITDYLNIFNQRKEESTRDLIRRLDNDGYHLDYDSICSTHQGIINRAVVASILMEKGYVPSVEEAFRTLLKPCHGYFVPPRYTDVFETIAFLRRQGAVSVLAHPFLSLSESALREFLPQAKQCGLVGMETLYATYSEETTALARQIAREFRLKESGGSDFHGETKPDIRLGIGKGSLSVPLSFARNLQSQEDLPCPGI